MSKTRSNWRKKVLDRLDELRGAFILSIPAEELEQMYKIAEKYDPQCEKVPSSASKPASRQVSEAAQPASSPAKKILSASCSFIQRISNPDVPYHLQIVVPGISGTVSANPQQIYEISVWERSLIQIFCEAGTSIVIFEFCNGMSPLMIDVFPTPTDQNTIFYWKSALENEIHNEMYDQILNLHSRFMKGVFPPNRDYIAVTFDDGKGLGKIWDGGVEPRRLAIEVVSQLWSSSEEEPPNDLDSLIEAYEGWPK